MAESCGGTLDMVFQDTYNLRYEAMVRVAQRYLDRRDLAEEAVQESFIRFRRSMETVEMKSPSAYLRMIVLNTARSMLRRRQCQDRWRPEHPVHIRMPDEVCVDADIGERVRNACAGLPDQQRRVVELRYWHDLSEAEISDSLGISRGSVKTHASRARAALHESLQGVAVS